MKVLDSSSVIGLYKELNETKIILIWKDLGHESFITIEVHAELQKNETTYKLFRPDFKKNIKLIEVAKPEEIIEFKNKYPYLGKGEISVILTGAKIKDNKCYCILDDRKARKVAQQQGILFTGTLGMIKKLKEKEIITPEKFDEILKKAEKSKFRIDPALFK